MDGLGTGARSSMKAGLERLGAMAVFVTAVALSLFVLGNIFYPLAPLQERSIFVLLVLFLLFLKDLARPERSIAWRLVDVLFLSGTVAAFGYVVVNHETIVSMQGLSFTHTTLLGLTAIVVAIEAIRRALGTALAAIIVGFLVYALFGEYLPWEYGGHGGYRLDRITNFIYLTTEGMFGVVTYTLFKYIFLFVMLGKLLEAVGALRFILNITLAFFGRFTGGPAMVAVMSSGMMGSVSGSANANVMLTGAVTIPLMTRIGYRPHVAAGVEAAASTGGQFMPPVMGTAAFLVAQVLGISYLSVVKAAILPASLYFLAMMIAVYFYAKRAGLRGLPVSELPTYRRALLDPAGITFLVGIGGLVTLLISGYSPIFSALLAMGALLAANMLSRERISIPRTVKVLADTSHTFLGIGSAGPGVGIIVGMILLTGLGNRFSAMILSFAGDNLIMVLGTTMVAAIVLGIGMPTPVTYIILAIMVAPAIVALGVDPLAAHLFIFFAGMMSMVTPPVGLAAYAASAIAGSDFWKTGLWAALLALPAYLLPYAFVLNNGLLLMGDWMDVLRSVALATLGVAAMSYALIGQVANSLEIPRRVLIFGAGLMLISPMHLLNGMGLLIGLLVWGGTLWLERSSRRLGQ